jgi:hypothetical protein
MIVRILPEKIVPIVVIGHEYDGGCPLSVHEGDANAFAADRQFIQARFFIT